MKPAFFYSSTLICLVSFLVSVHFPLEKGKGNKRQAMPFLLPETHPLLSALTDGSQASQAEAFRNVYLLPWRSKAGKVRWFLEIRL